MGSRDIAWLDILPYFRTPDIEFLALLSFYTRAHNMFHAISRDRLFYHIFGYLISSFSLRYHIVSRHMAECFHAISRDQLSYHISEHTIIWSYWFATILCSGTRYRVIAHCYSILPVKSRQWWSYAIVFGELKKFGFWVNFGLAINMLIEN